MNTLKKVYKASALFIMAAILFTSGCTSHDKTIVVGGKNFTEQYILSEMAAILLRNNGFRVQMRTGVGSTLARRSLENGQIDLYYEYTGTSYTIYHNQSDKSIMTDPVKSYEWVKTADAEKDLIWLDPVQFNNSYTLLMRMDHAQREGINTISDLGKYITENPGTLSVGLGSEFWERPDGFKSLMELYDFTVPDASIRKMDDGLVYMALKDGLVDVSSGFSTDGRIAAFGFVDLKDDRSHFPMYNPAPVVRFEVLEEFPEIRDILKPVSEKLTTEEMRRLNAMVDVEHRQINDVVTEWLKDKELLK